ncbi:FUSC family protein [Sciscionella sediminilitoris]|uniref:FUSC family protein n=1 Tax=Sciscionella sediminilitoris TaxID=1445613 RepID=UPI0018D1E10D|nr:FUSC family protein [Sciscionella sp. SE31]
MLLKAVVAASAAWGIAAVVLGLPSATFAPFSALLTVRATVVQSIDQSLRYAAAVLVGVTLAGLVELPIGPNLPAFVLLMFLALALSRIREFGGQGVQVSVAAAFAYAALAGATNWQQGLVRLGWLAALVALGCALGLVVNFVIAPPLRYRHVASSVHFGGALLATLLSEISTSLRTGIPTQRTTDFWRDRCEAIPESLAQAQQTIADSAQTMRINPRRLLMRQSSSLDRYRTIVETLDRAVGQCVTITHGLASINTGEYPSGDTAEHFLLLYAGFLDDITKAVRILSQLPAHGNKHTLRSLDMVVSQAWRSCHQLPELTAEQQGSWPTLTALRIDAHRLTEEIAKVARSFEALSRGE